MTRRAHLVGSIGLQDSATVFRTVSEILGDACTRIPDGETGERHYWIRWQARIFENHPHMEAHETSEGYREGTPLRQFRMRDGVAPDALEFGELGYARAALDSYKIFAAMKSGGDFSAKSRFQVSLPTATAVLTSFVAPREQSAVEPAYEKALLAELDQILAAIPHDQLAIQWDICHEILAYDGAFKLHYADILPGTLSRMERYGLRIPEAVELGFHLCYGDPGHKHIQEPQDTGSAVKFANGLSGGIGRRVDWIHLPVPRGRDDDAYFAPLQDLALRPEIELVLGLVHYTDGVEGTKNRIATAEKVVKNFNIATECGFGRRDAATIPKLLEIHKALCT